MSDDELSQVDPLAMNLIVAREIPALTELDLSRYQRIVNAWTADLAEQIPAQEAVFHRYPERCRHDLDRFRLGLIA